MGLSPVVLYDAVFSDVSVHLPFAPVGLGDVPPDASLKSVQSCGLLASIVKKWIPEDTIFTDLASLKTFLASNKTCENWRLRLEWEKDVELFGLLREELDNFFHPGGQMLFSSYSDLLERGRAGPGSSIGMYGASFYAKHFASPLTSTSKDLYTMYKAYTWLYPEFSIAEVIRTENHGQACIVDGSRSSFVPKSTKTSRMICTEPSVNMFYQLGLGDILQERLLKSWKLDLRTQPDDNRRLARHGSKTNRFSTIDLESASDSISIEFCRSVLPSWFFRTLMEIRSCTTQIPSQLLSNLNSLKNLTRSSELNTSSSLGCGPVELHMMSTMGNGFTFPLQTIIFGAMVRACYRFRGLRIHDASPRNWAVFGDDLIVESSCFHDLSRLLSLAGFSVNRSKTFNEGHFRESCGTDWWQGHPVRGVFLKKLQSLQDHFIAINLLNEWTAVTGITLPNTIEYLLSGISPKFRTSWVPFDETYDSGIRVPSIFLTAETTKRDLNLSVLYRVFRPIRQVLRIGDGTIHVPRGSKKLIYNPSGLLISFLRGEVTTGTISVRHDLTVYRTKLKCTPYWDYIPRGYSIFGVELPWCHWKNGTIANMAITL